ncbi:MAG: HNH endonuclease [Acidobacteria bacterium]|nr:HNH endonuclease [Acidobacteriota bacterium]
MRGEFSNPTRRQAFERAGGRCEICAIPFTPGKFAYDHRDPEWMCGDSTLGNCQVICNQCHADKTAVDAGNRSHVKRLIDRQLGIPKRKGPPMAGTRASGWKKLMNGQVVERR